MVADLLYKEYWGDLSPIPNDDEQKVGTEDLCRRSKGLLEL